LSASAWGVMKAITLILLLSEWLLLEKLSCACHVNAHTSGHINKHIDCSMLTAIEPPNLLLEQSQACSAAHQFPNKIKTK